MDSYREHFGFKLDPFVYCEPFESADLKTVRRAFKSAAEDRAWVAIVGSPGAGKTYALDVVQAELDCWLVAVLGGERTNCSASHIDDALFLEVGAHFGERKRSSREARRRQLRRILGEASAEKPIVIRIDESTQVRGNLLTDIKFLRDSLRFGSDPHNPRRQDPRPLFGVVHVGWPSFADRLRKSNELRPRVRIVEMKGFSRSEVEGYVEHLGLARIVSERAVRAIADRTRLPLLINERLQLGMESAALRDAKRVEPEDIEDDATDIKVMMRRLDTTNKEVAEATGLSPSHVSQIAGGYQVSQSAKDRVLGHLRGLQAEKQAQAV